MAGAVPRVCCSQCETWRHYTPHLHTAPRRAAVTLAGRRAGVWRGAAWQAKWAGGGEQAISGGAYAVRGGRGGLHQAAQQKKIFTKTVTFIDSTLVASVADMPSR